MEAEKDWGEVIDGLPFSSQHRIPITSAVIYHFRWRINNIRLMLYDVKELRDKYKIPYADKLYELLEDEAMTLCEKMIEIIQEKLKLIEERGGE